MLAKDFPFEVGDRVTIDTQWKENGTVLRINDGPIVEWVNVELDDGSFAIYAPEQVKPVAEK